LVKIFAEKKSIMDIPNVRSSHTVPTPRGGGLAIVFTWFAGITYLYFTDNINEKLYFAFLAGLPILIVSIIDDLINVSPYIRIIIQSLSAISALYFLGNVSGIDLGFIIFSNKFLIYAFSFLLILWFTNLFNFIDGIDGYLSSGVIFFGTVLFLFTKDSSMLILVFSVLGFIIWNWQPAKIFMGDAGSTLLGYTFIIYALYFENSSEFPLLMSLILSSLFWFDATYTLIFRIIKKEKISSPHKKHIYQRLVQSGYSHQKVVLISFFVNILIGGILLFVGNYNEYLIYSLIFVIFLMLILTALVNKKKPFTENI